jgi:hypothetical protein
MEGRLKHSPQIIWDGAFRTIKVNESDTQALIDIGLLYGYEVCIETIVGRIVKIMNLSTYRPPVANAVGFAGEGAIG